MTTEGTALLLEALAGPAVEFGPGGAVLRANAAFRRLVAPSALSTLEWIAEPDRLPVRAQVDACLQKQRPVEARFRASLVDGEFPVVALLAPAHAEGRATCLALLHLSHQAEGWAPPAEADRPTLLSLAVATAGIGVWEADLERGEVSWSPEMRAILGKRTWSGPLTLETFRARMHPLDREAAWREMGAAIKERRAFRLRYRLYRSDGSLVHVLHTGRADPSRPSRLVGTVQDVTDQMRRVEELERVRADLEHTQRTAGIGSWRLALPSGETRWSPEIFRIAGLNPTEFVPTTENRDRIYHPDDRPTIEEIRADMAAGRDVSGRYRVLRPDGTARWVENHGAPVFDEDGRLAAYAGTARDVTEAVEHQATLDRVNHHLRVAQSVARVGSWERDLRTLEGYWSDEMYRLFGLEPGSVEPSLELLRNMTHPEDRPTVQSTRARAEHGDDEASNLIRIIRADGEQRWLRVRSIREYEDGVPVRLVGIDQDVTEFVETQRALEESERLLREAHAAARQGHWDWDIRTGDIAWSEQIFHIFGQPPDAFEPSYERFLQHVHPDDRPCVEEAVRAAVEDGALYRVRHRVLRGDGAPCVVEESGQVIADADGRPVRMLGIVRDITQQALQEAELERVRTSLEHAQRIARVGSYEWDPRTGETWLSDEAYRLYGMEPGDPRATMDNFLRGMRTSDRERFLEALNPRLEAMDRLEEPDRLSMTVHTRTVAGDNLVLLHIGEASPQPDGRVVVRGALMDVTEQVRLREQAEEAARETASIIAASLLPIIVIDEDGAIQMANAATERVFGWSEAELVGRDVSILAADITEEEHRGYIRHFMETGQASTPEGLVVGRSREVRGVRRDGTEFPAQLTVAESQSARGRRFTGIVMDLTAAKSAEERLLRVQKSEALGTLVAGVAHDFNNLLTAIQGGIEMATEDLGSSRWLHIADQAAARAADLVQQLLRFSRREEPRRATVSPAELVDETALLVRELLDRQITLDVRLGTDLPALQGDSGQLQQVLLNLVVNARDAVLARASQAGEGYQPSITLTVAAYEQGGAPGVRFTCEDNGTGMPPAVVERAFDPFFTTKSVDQGTGLGLATVSGIVEQHDGTVSLESEPGRGTIVHVWIPLSAPSDQDHEGDPEGAAPPLEPSPAPPLVLVVDDEEAIGEIAQGFLEGAGYEVILTTRGDQAIDLVRADPSALALAVVDLNMPAPDGWTVLAALREAAPDLPVLIASGYADAEEVLASGGAALLPKPYTRAQLLAAAAALIRESSPD